MPSRLFLTGFMGCGKTTTGRLLAGTLDQDFVDLDEWVEFAAGMDVRTIFETRGELVFRKLESEALERTSEVENAVVATGGGTVTVPRNRSWMRRHGLSFWLNVPFSTMAARVGGVERWDRPLFRDETQALELYRERVPSYREADFVVDIDATEEANEIATRIVLMLGDRVCDS
jgi:shikimate kinase